MLNPYKDKRDFQLTCHNVTVAILASVMRILTGFPSRFPGEKFKALKGKIKQCIISLSNMKKHLVSIFLE